MVELGLLRMKFGPFHRIGNPKTQSMAAAKLQGASETIWGRTPRGGMEPTIQAYIGSLPSNREGIEFMTNCSPYDTKVAGEVRWNKTLSPVNSICDVNNDTISMKVAIIKYCYVCKKTAA